jgi:hypothetical protein
VTYQAGLPTDNPSFPVRLHGGDEEDVFRFLGADVEGRGHYWLQSGMLHSVVYAVNEDYRVEEAVTWLAEGSVCRYLGEEGLQGLSEFAKSYLEGLKDADTEVN